MDSRTPCVRRREDDPRNSVGSSEVRKEKIAQRGKKTREIFSSNPEMRESKTRKGGKVLAETRRDKRGGKVLKQLKNPMTTPG